MKLFLPITLGIVCIALAIGFYKTKKADDAQHDSDIGSIVSYSNRLDAAESELNARGETILTLSNSLDACRSVSLTLSNQLTDVKSTVLNQSGQITNLNAQIVAVNAEKMALDEQRMNLTNQVGLLTNQLVQTQAVLARANNDYALLENRFRINVAERVVTERKFNNLASLQTQIENLKTNPVVEISADQIFAGLNVEVKSNGTVHVITPD